MMNLCVSVDMLSMCRCIIEGRLLEVHFDKSNMSKSDYEKGQKTFLLEKLGLNRLVSCKT